MKLLLLCFAVVCVLALSSCKQNGPRPVADHTVSGSDLPGKVTARVGESIDLVLGSNPSTGYSWHMDWAPKAVLTKLGDGYEAVGEQKPGSGGVQHYVFKAAQPGRAVVTVQYGRWWQGGDREPVKKLRVTVTK
jgi:predicted secreted protein